MPKKLTNIPALARSVADLAAEVERLAARPDPQPLPSDLARLSDIPEPPDLAPITTKIQELERQISAMAGSIPVVPDNLARKSDIPEPVDLAPVMQRMADIESDQESIRKAAVELEAGVSRAVASLSESVTKLTAALDVLRRDLSETRAWVGDLGQAWQAHREAVHAAASSAECVVEGLSGRVDTLEARTCPPVQDLSPLSARLNTIELQLAEIMGGDE